MGERVCADWSEWTEGQLLLTPHPDFLRLFPKEAHPSTGSSVTLPPPSHSCSPTALYAVFFGLIIQPEKQSHSFFISIQHLTGPHTPPCSHYKNRGTHTQKEKIPHKEYIQTPSQPIWAVRPLRTEQNPRVNKSKRKGWMGHQEGDSLKTSTTTQEGERGSGCITTG